MLRSTWFNGIFSELHTALSSVYPTYLIYDRISHWVEYLHCRVSIFITTVTAGSSAADLCWSHDSAPREQACPWTVNGGPVHCQQHHTKWVKHSDLDSQARSGKRMKIDRNIMNCLGILSAIFTDIGLQFGRDIIAHCTYVYPGLKVTHKWYREENKWLEVILQPVIKSRQLPLLLWFIIAEVLLLAIVADSNLITGRGEVLV